MGSLQQRSSGENNGVFHLFHSISSAVDADDFLLLSHCPRSTHQGTQEIVIVFKRILVTTILSDFQHL